MKPYGRPAIDYAEKCFRKSYAEKGVRPVFHLKTGEIIKDSSACCSSRPNQKRVLRNAKRSKNKSARQKLKKDIEYDY